MTEILAVFRSRSQAVDCSSKMRAYNISVSLINTPKECNVGCGLSVKIAPSAFNAAKRIIMRSGYSAFYGFYKFTDDYGRISVYRL